MTDWQFINIYMSEWKGEDADRLVQVNHNLHVEWQELKTTRQHRSVM